MRRSKVTADIYTQATTDTKREAHNKSRETGGALRNPIYGPISVPVVHAIDLFANLEVLDIFADRRDDCRKFMPWHRSRARCS